MNVFGLQGCTYGVICVMVRYDYLNLIDTGFACSQEKGNRAHDLDVG